jgi:hypothetical protein
VALAEDCASSRPVIRIRNFRSPLGFFFFVISVGTIAEMLGVVVVCKEYQMYGQNRHDQGKVERGILRV